MSAKIGRASQILLVNCWYHDGMERHLHSVQSAENGRRVMLTRPNRFAATSHTSTRCIRKYPAAVETSSLRRINVTSWQSPPVGPTGTKVLVRS